MRTRGLVCALLFLAAATVGCNGFDGFNLAGQRIALGQGERVTGNGDLSQPRFTNGGSSNYLVVTGFDEQGLASVFVLNVTTLEATLISRADTVVDGATGLPFEPVPDRGADSGSTSRDGRVATYLSDATNLLQGERTTEDRRHVYVRDQAADQNILISRGFGGAEANADSTGAQISADGRFVVFASRATNLVPAADNGASQIFIFDLVTGLQELLTFTVAGSDVVPGTGDSGAPAVSPDGRFVAFASDASNLVTGDDNGTRDIFVRDRSLRTTERVSLGVSGDADLVDVGRPAISHDGNIVVFSARPSEGARRQIFVRDRRAGTTTIVSVDLAGFPGNEESSAPVVSPDGRFVAFQSDATNLVPGDTNGVTDVFVYDVSSDLLSRVSVDSDGDEADGESRSPSISPDGTIIAFISRAMNLVRPTTSDPTPNDTIADVYLFANPLFPG